MFMTASTRASVSGMASATTAPGRTPSVTKLTTRMMTIACHSESVKSLIAPSTVTAWSETRNGSMPTGRSARMRAISIFRLRPSAMILVGIESPRNTQEDALLTGLQHAGRLHPVLRLQLRNQIGIAEAEPGKLRGRELEKHLL